MKTLEQILSDIEERANAATPGPWYSRRRNYSVWVDSEDTLNKSSSEQTFNTLVDYPTSNEPGTNADVDCEFIAHARQDVPRLIAALRIVLNLNLSERYKSSQVTEFQKQLLAALSGEKE